jgi:hypothetical protein
LHDPGNIGCNPLVNLTRRPVAGLRQVSVWFCRLGHPAILKAANRRRELIPCDKKLLFLRGS